MKLFQKLVCMALTATATASLSICAFAADYTFDTAADTDYYPSTSYTQCALYAAATQAANRSGIAASGGKPAPRHRRNAKRRFCAAAVWRTATRQEWYSKPHGSFSGCTAA